MTDEDRLLVELRKLGGDVIGNLGDAVARHRAGIPARRFRRFRVSRPARGNGRIAIRPKEIDPFLPGFGVEPESVNEDYGGLGGSRVGRHSNTSMRIDDDSLRPRYFRCTSMVAAGGSR